MSVRIITMRKSRRGLQRSKVVGVANQIIPVALKLPPEKITGFGMKMKLRTRVILGLCSPCIIGSRKALLWNRSFSVRTMDPASTLFRFRYNAFNEMQYSFTTLGCQLRVNRALELLLSNLQH